MPNPPFQKSRTQMNRSAKTAMFRQARRCVTDTGLILIVIGARFSLLGGTGLEPGHPWVKTSDRRYSAILAFTSLCVQSRNRHRERDRFAL